MKKKKVVMATLGIVCLIAAVIVLVIALTMPEHTHKLSEEKTYHITNKGVHYTRVCTDGCKVKFETQLSVADALVSGAEIVVDEDVVLTKEIDIKGFTIKDELPEPLELNINLNLNKHTISTDIENVVTNALFTFNANYGKINFNIKNGKIETNDIAYIFSFITTPDAEDVINLNIDKVECSMVGHKATPIYAHQCDGVTINATNSKFKAYKSSQEGADYGVGTFINANGEFNFTDCYFEGADALYVKHGTVNLTRCTLSNVELAYRGEQATEVAFCAIGTCLATESYTTSEGMTKFTITITDCSMIRVNSCHMIYVAQTGEVGQTLSINPQSSINVISCTFSDNPTAIVNYDIVHYPNNEPPVNQGNNMWEVG